jgi:predicted DNA-binding transcriptional regulator YafY
MSKRGYISRYMLIIKRLKKKPYQSVDELQAYIESQLEYLRMQDDTLTIGNSERTLKRDFREIKNLFGIEIKYSKREKGYYINQTASENMNFQRMVEAFEIFNSLNLSDELKPIVLIENRKPQGTEHLFGIIHAIKNNLLIKFQYQKFWDDVAEGRNVAPLAIKEFKSRWYIIAKDTKDQKVKTFGLDRISELEISKEIFVFNDREAVLQKFKNCFGIFSPDEELSQKVILSFDSIQGKYIKSLPLHETQQIIKENDEELQIKLQLKITHDLLMELLSFGDSVKILKPKKLIASMKSIYKSALMQYD